MPDRIVRSKILSSEAVNQLSWPGEVFYRRLFSVADDYGRFDARTSILRAAVFPLRLDKVSDADVVKWLGECSKAGLVSVYQVEGKEYLEILKFGQRLRAMKSQYPPPETGTVIPCEGIRGQMSADVGNVGQMLQEEKRSRIEVEEEEKRSLADCMAISLKDPRWVKANSTNQKELETFNLLLEKRGHYEKNPADYKSHFANWKMGGKKDTDVKQNELPGYQKQNSNAHIKSL